VCLCSSDKVYADAAARIGHSLAAAGARYIWLAGPTIPEDAREIVDATLSVGCDAVAVLETTLRKATA
jgi:methylmalonyl-CoA mutase